ncbi:hypothetical protein MTR_8g009690 [Medicago truncatula]|uniref:Uncharacterized protein n=1 Tax=Medicago truncatula TaxID=3880 RepID=A0A072TMC8_MEDTR|nr:hypothetical protein MTR_8g009690 [Medicago truncatula]
MTTNVKIRSHKAKLIKAMFLEISVKARKETAYPNKSMSEIGKIVTGCCNSVIPSLGTKFYCSRDPISWHSIMNANLRVCTFLQMVIPK